MKEWVLAIHGVGFRNRTPAFEFNSKCPYQPDTTLEKLIRAEWGWEMNSVQGGHRKLSPG